MQSKGFIPRLVITQAGNPPPVQQLHLKALSRMNTETRYPRADEAPTDLYDARDSQTSLVIANKVIEHIQSIISAN